MQARGDNTDDPLTKVFFLTESRDISMKLKPIQEYSVGFERQSISYYGFSYFNRISGNL